MVEWWQSNRFLYSVSSNIRIKIIPKEKKNCMLKWLKIHETQSISTKMLFAMFLTPAPVSSDFFRSYSFCISTKAYVWVCVWFGHRQCDFVFKFVRNEYRMWQKLASNNTFYISFCSPPSISFDKTAFVCLLSCAFFFSLSLPFLVLRCLPVMAK